MITKRFVSALLCSAVLLSVCGSSVCAAIEANLATPEELAALRGLGSKRAQRIIDERRRNGPYLGPGDLSRRVPGLGPKTIARLQQQGLSVNGEREPVALLGTRRRRR